MFAFALAAATAFVGTPSVEAAEWEKISEPEDKVAVFRKEVEGQNVFAFKGVTTVDLHVGNIISIYTDSSTQKDWVDRYDASGNLKIMDPLERIYWIHFGLPFPISDRDYVLHVNAELDHEKRTFTSRIKSVDHPGRPEDDCCVRGKAFGTYYLFEGLDGGKTRLTVEVHTDPMGMLPSWLVNIIQKKWPAKTLNGLVKRSRRSGVKVYAGTEGWHEPPKPPEPDVTPPVAAPAAEAAPAVAPAEGAAPAAAGTAGQRTSAGAEF